jgi:hypothetical protein
VRSQRTAKAGQRAARGSVVGPTSTNPMTLAGSWTAASTMIWQLAE